MSEKEIFWRFIDESSNKIDFSVLIGNDVSADGIENYIKKKIKANPGDEIEARNSVRELIIDRSLVANDIKTPYIVRITRRGLCIKQKKTETPTRIPTLKLRIRLALRFVTLNANLILD